MDLNKEGISKRNDGAWEMDSAAFLPDPQGYVKVGGESYPIFSFLDIPVADAMKVVKIHERINATDDFDERMALSIEHLVALSSGPDNGRGNRKVLTAELLRGLPARMVIGLVVLANSIASVPQKANADQSQTASV